MSLTFNFCVVGGKVTHTNAVVQLTLKGWTEIEGSLRISEDLMTPREIDERIDSLKSELDAVGRRAKKALEKAS